MCPLRFLLIFFSTVLAAYFAWTTVRSSPEIDFTARDHSNKSSSNKDRSTFMKVLLIQHFFLFLVSFFLCWLDLLLWLQVIKNGFWVFVDMASGRYLWRNLKSTKDNVQLQSSWELDSANPNIEHFFIFALLQLCNAEACNSFVYFRPQWLWWRNL